MLRSVMAWVRRLWERRWSRTRAERSLVDLRFEMQRLRTQCWWNLAWVAFVALQIAVGHLPLWLTVCMVLCIVGIYADIAWRFTVLRRAIDAKTTAPAHPRAAA